MPTDECVNTAASVLPHLAKPLHSKVPDDIFYCLWCRQAAPISMIQEEKASRTFLPLGAAKKRHRKVKMVHRRRYRKSHPFRNFIITLLIVLASGVVILWQAGPLKQKVAQKVGTQIMETAADSAASKIAEASGGAISEEAAKQEIQQGLDSMSSEDRESLTEIVENHMDSKSVSEITGQILQGNIQEAAKSAAEELTPEEYQKLQEIAQKYLGQSLP